MDSRQYILVVEDDAALREELAELLRDEGYTVEVCGDGQEAMGRLFSHDRPALIISDLMMPHLSGWELAKLLKCYKSSSRIPLIAISASLWDPPDDVPFLKKPIDTRRLLRLIKQHVHA
jgi:CheY-like chemotaxis protein